MPIVETMGFVFVACGAPVLLLQCVELGRATWGEGAGGAAATAEGENGAAD